MGQITKTPSDKHNASLCPAVDDFVKTSTIVPLYQLPSHLASFPRTWPLPRGDLHHWIPTLNRFDTILQEFNDRYELNKGPQTQPLTRQLLRTADTTSSADPEISEDVLDESGFSPDGDRELVEAILEFSRLLLEKCGSRSLYSSSSHISNLLNSTSLSLVQSALRLGLCLAQRYSSSRARSGPHHHHHQLNQNLLASHYAFSLESIESLAQPFVKSLSTVNDLETAVRAVEKNSFVTTYAPDLLTVVRQDDSAETRWEDYGGAWLSFDDLSNSESRPPTANGEDEASGSTSNHAPQPGSPTDAVANNVTSDTPRKDRATLLEVPCKQISSQSTEKLLKEVLPKVPTEKRYELLDKVRAARALTGSVQTRQQIITIRLLAIANLAHVYPENLLQAKVLQHESEGPRSSQLPQQLCDLVHPPGGGSPGVPKQLQTVALLTLAALTKHKTRASDVSAALSVNVSHGMLSFVARKGVAELESDQTGVEDLEDREWRDSLFSLLHELPKSNTRVADGFVSGGLLEILVESLTYRTSKAEANHPRVLKFLDYFIFNKREAFQSLANTKGLDAISELAEFEVVSSTSAVAKGRTFPERFKSRNTDFQIPFVYQQTLSQLFRFVNHMIANSQGAFDRQVRNLVESSQLLGSLKTVMQNPTPFGSEVWSQAVSVFSTFLHNEPTSFTTMAEAGVSQAFLETITQKKLSSVDSDPSSNDDDGSAGSLNNNACQSNHGASGVLPTMEVINCLPEAFGAICLVEAGMRQFESSEALETFFKIFTSPAHLKCLADPNADVEDLGTSLDELARHHPRLKPTIVKNISSVARTTATMYANPSRPAGARLVLDKNETSVLEVPAQPSSLIQENSDARRLDAQQEERDPDTEMAVWNDIKTQDPVSNDISAEALQRIGVFSHFLFGFLVNTNMITPFSETSGIEDLLDLATSPVLPYNFNGAGSGYTPEHAAVFKLIQVFHCLIDQKAHLVLPSIVRRALEETHRLGQFLDHAGEGPYFAAYLNLSAANLAEAPGGNDIGTATIKSLLNLQTLCCILSKSLVPMNSRSNPNSFSGVNLADMYATLIPLLGRLQSKCLWESTDLEPLIPPSFKQTDLSGRRVALQASSIENGQPQADTQSDPSTGIDPILAQEVSSLLANNSPEREHGTMRRRMLETSNNGKSASTPEERNYLVIRFLLRSVPPVIASLFATVGKSLVVRRGQMDAYQKQNMLLMADRIAEALSKQLDDVEVHEHPSPAADFVRYVCLTNIARSMMDKRAEPMDRGGSQILTMVINAFKKRNGFVKLGQILSQLFERATGLLKTSQEERSSRHVNLAFSSMDVILKMFANLTNDKKFLEAQQTVALSSRADRDKDRPDFFLPSQFLVELRYEATQAILPIWNSELIEHSVCHTVKTMTEIFRNVLEGDGELSAFKRSDKTPDPGNSPRKRWKLRNTENLTRLMDRGYSQDLAQEALYRCNEGSPSSSEYCAAYTHNPSLPRNPIPFYDTPATADAPLTSQTSDASSEHIAPETALTAVTTAIAPQDEPSEHSTGPASNDSQSANIVPLANADQPQENQGLVSSGVNLELPKALYLIRVEHLEDKRTELRDGLMDRCLTVSKSFPTLSFDLADLITASVSKSQDPSSMRQDICETLTQSLISLQGSGSLQANAQKISADAHLLGVVLQEKDFFEAAKENLRDSLSGLLGFLVIEPDQKLGESPVWIPRVLLIIEKVMAEDAQPHQIQWTPPTEDQIPSGTVAELPEPLVPPEEKRALFDILIELLPRIGKNVQLGLAVVRTLVPLTRDRTLAKELGSRRNMQRMFVMVKQLAGHFNDKFNANLLIVLRHVVEDDDTIRQIMRSEIKAAFEKPPRQIDTTTYTRSLYHLVLRAPAIFVEITNEMLMIPKFDRNQNPQTLALKTDYTSTEEVENASSSAEVINGADKNETGTALVQQSMEVDQPTNSSNSTETVKGPVVVNPDGVIHFLLSELLTYKEVPDKEPLPAQDSKASEDTTDVDMKEDNTNSGTPSGSVKIANDTSSTNQRFKVEDHPIYVYRCFILQCITELLQSYNKTKIEFTNYSRKADPHAVTPSKPHSGVLNYLLNSLIPLGTLDHPNDIPSRKKAATSKWAVKVIAALCSRTNEKGPPPRRSDVQKDEEPDLLFVRKFVLEHVMRAFRDANSSTDPFDLKYSRMLSIADLLNDMLADRLSDSSMRAFRDQRDDTLAPTQRGLAKIMFEKNFISALTSSIADVDLNNTGANRAVKHILRPLRLLTQAAIDLSMTSELSSSPGPSDEDEISSATSVSDLAEDREETPDLFRHSTLGMFEPGRENEPSSESDDEDEDEEMYGDDYDDEMDYDEEDEVEEDDELSDEDAEMTGVGPVEGLSGDVNMDVEIELEEDDMSSSDGEEDDEDDEDDDESESHSSDDEDDEDDMDDEIEVVEEDVEDEFVDEEHAEEDEWQHDGEHMPFAIRVGDPPQTLSVSESRSEHELALIPGPGDPLNAELEIEADHGGSHEGESDGEADDDEDDFEEDEERDLHDHADYDIEEDEGPPWFWPMGPGRRATVPHHHHIARVHPESYFVPPGDRYSSYRAHRTGGPSNADEGINPLLQRERSANANVGWPPPTRQGGNRPSIFDELGELSRRLPPIGANNPMSYLSELLQALGRGGPGQLPTHHHHQDGSIHFSIPAVPGGNFSLDLPPPDMEALVGSRQDMPSRNNVHDPGSSVSFSPSLTTERWQAEARLLFGSSYVEKCSKVINSILQLLVPPAIEAERVQKEKEAEARKMLEEERERQRVEQEAKEKQEREEREAREKAEAEAIAAEAAAAAELEAAQEATGEEAATAEASNIPSEAMEGIVPTSSQTAPVEYSAESSAETAPRVHTNIRGRQLDITDLGIDLAYLEALPEEMREEVIMQQYAEQRSQAAAAGEEPTAINSEFLDALPPDIREELLQQEAQDRRRREREDARRQSAATNGGSAQPAEMDPASFITSLDPVLRQSVLAEADDEMLASLPPEFVAEARALGGHRRRPLDPARLLGDMESQDGRSRPVYDETMQLMMGMGSRPRRGIVVQMLDKAGVATLLRLMFIPVTGNARQSLNGILRNACGNRQTRGEVVAGLLSILQEGSIDVNAVERSFTQLTLKAKQSGAQKPQQIKGKAASVANIADSSPLTVISQCLNALVFLTQTVTHISHFFLSENESFGGFKSKSNKKGKGKEVKGNKYPINALLSLLDRKVVVENAAVIEQLAGLLQTVTQPLNAIRQSRDRSTNTNGETPWFSTVGSETRTTEQPREDASTNVTTGTGDATRTIASLNEEQAGQDAPTGTEVEPSAEGPTALAAEPSGETKSDKQTEVKKSRPLTPPEIPEENLRLIINILMARDCSSKTFRDTLSLITNLSTIPSAKKIFGDELVKRARDLGQDIFNDLLKLIKSLKGAENEMQAQSLALANFSPAGSDQSKFNRILTALDYLFDVKSDHDKDSKENEAVNARAGQDLLSNLNDDPSFGKLWGELSEALSATQQSGHYFFNVATILLPLIEALMVVCKRLPLKESAYLANRNELGSPMTEVNMMVRIFFSFTNRHKKILNDLVRHTPKLMSGSFASLVKNPSVLEFDNKRNYFNRRLHQRSSTTRNTHPTLQLNVRRDQVFLDSYAALHFKSANEIKYGKLHIRFHNEEGVDAGGVTREWFSVLARQMFNPDYALFNPVASDKTTFHPNPLSEINEQHLHFFKFIGRVIGKALYENRVLDCHFSRAVYKRILGKPVSMKDMETIDLDYSKSMEWILENDITDIITETFSVAFDRFGVEQIIDLVPNGRNTPVTEENKHEFVRLVIEYKLTGAVNDQLESFLSGFHDIVPPELISIFDENELELLISGMPDVDVDDWKNNTEYHNYNANSPQVQWFWRAVRSFDKEERAKLLQFVTGAGKVPLNGFKELEGMNGITRFSIHKDFGSKDRLPSSHTCFNQLDLPEYDSYEGLRKNLYTAMTTGNEYFGYA